MCVQLIISKPKGISEYILVLHLVLNNVSHDFFLLQFPNLHKVYVVNRRGACRGKKHFKISGELDCAGRPWKRPKACQRLLHTPACALACNMSDRAGRILL